MKQFFSTTLLVFTLLAVAVPSMAQITTQDEKAPSKNDERQYAPKSEKLWKWKNFYVGGIPGFGISSYYVNVSVSAEAGYFVHSHVALGAQMTYSYTLDKYYDVSYNVIRFGPYARGYIWEGLFAQVEYDLTTVKNYQDHSFSPPVTIDRLNNNSLLIGGGYHDNFENGFGFYFAILAGVINSSTALTANPDFRIGVSYRLNGGKYHQNKKKPTKND